MGMVRASLTALGFTLLVFWVIGLSDPGTTVWLAWADCAAGLLSFGGAVLVPARAHPARAMTPPFLLATLLGALTAIGFASGASWWLTWWNLIFALFALAVTFGGLVQAELPRLRTPPVL